MANYTPPESNKKLIEEFKNYNEDNDPGRHRYSKMYKELLRRGLIEGDELVPANAETESMRITRISLEQKIAAAKNPEDKAFFENLLRSLQNIA